MKLRIQQAALTCALALPLIVTFVFAGPFTAAPGAQGAMRMVSPQFPILGDTTGNGMPGAGDVPLNPTYSNGQSQLLIPQYFSCDTQPNNVVTLGDIDSAGKVTRASRRNDALNQSMSLTGLQQGKATQATYNETTLQGTLKATGVGRLMDGNGDGKAELVQITGNINMMVTLVFTPDSSAVTIPQSQAEMLGARAGDCGPRSIPLIFVPLADTDGDGRGDTVILDLDGNGVADPQFYVSAPLGALAVPTTNTFGLILLTLMLGAIGVWYLGQRRLGDAGA